MGNGIFTTEETFRTLVELPVEVTVCQVFAFLPFTDLVKWRSVNNGCRAAIENHSSFFVPSATELLNRMFQGSNISINRTQFSVHEMIAFLNRPLQYVPVSDYVAELRVALETYDYSGGVLETDMFRVHPFIATLTYLGGLPPMIHKLAAILKLQRDKEQMISQHGPITQGQLLQFICNKRKDHLKVGEESIELVPDPVDASNDIYLMQDIANPPYGLSLPPNSNCVQVIEEKLFRSFDMESSYSWTGSTDWSPYWIAGEEWWGCYGITYYYSSDHTLVAAFASTTD